MKKTKQKKSRLGQYDAKYFLAGLNISEPLRFAPLHRYVFNNLQKILLTLYGPRSLEDKKSRTRRDSQPRPFYSASISSSICTTAKNVAFDIFKNLKEEAGSIVFKISSDEFFASFFAEKKEEPRHGLSGIEAKHSGMEDKRNLIIQIASKELGIREATGNNDGHRVEEYLRYTNLGKGYDWCASFVSWVYGQAGFPKPRNPWSPALFPKTRRITAGQAADLFGIYGVKAKRINHVGLIKERQATYLLTIEGNSNNRVESRRRHLNTIYALADWVE